MLGYTIRRLLLIIPTLISIFTVNFFIVQMAPGGPVDQVLAEMRGLDSSMAMERLSGQGGEDIQEQTQIDDFEEYSGARGLDPKIIAEIEKRFGFDRPIHERYFTTLWNYLRFDFGESFFRGGSVIDLVVERIPVSVSLGLWTMLLTYLISIPLGIRKAVKEGTPFDTWTSLIVSVGRAVPAFLFAILLIVLFAGGSFLDLFPIKGLVSRGWEDFPWWQQILDYFWHLTLPVIAMTIGSFAFLTIFTKNNFLEEISKQYVVTARAKGNTEKNIPLQTRLPQLDALSDRRLPFRLYFPFLYRQSSYRNHVYHRRTGLPGLHLRPPEGLSRYVRDPFPLFTDWTDFFAAG
jgi:microcin C transport system permease protein